MATARVFKSGNSQAVRLPKQFRVNSKKLEIERRGDEIILREPARGIERALLSDSELAQRNSGHPRGYSWGSRTSLPESWAVSSMTLACAASFRGNLAAITG